MIATIVNALAVLTGGVLGRLLHARITDNFKRTVTVGAGVMVVILAVRMSLESSKIVFLALSLIIGGILGEWWHIEDGILSPGEDFAYGFLTGSVL